MSPRSNVLVIVQRDFSPTYEVRFNGLVIVINWIVWRDKELFILIIFHESPPYLKLNVSIFVTVSSVPFLYWIEKLRIKV